MIKWHFLLCLPIFVAACSNPFSGTHTTIDENKRPTNSACSEVRFDQSQITQAQFRAVIHCLNQNHELEALDAWAKELTDVELQPWLTQFNTLIENEPEFIYGINQLYLQQKNSGQLAFLLSQLFSEIKKKNATADLVSILKKHQRWLEKFVSEDEYKINTSAIALLTEVNAFKRATQELSQNNSLNETIRAIKKYHSAADALSFQEIFTLLEKTSRTIIKDQASVNKIAGFTDWLARDNHIREISQATRSLIEKPILCFDGSKKIEMPYKTLTSQLSLMSPTLTVDFFNKQGPAALLMGRTLCDIPSEIYSASKLLQVTTQEETYVDFFKLIQPLITDERFSKLLTSSSFVELTESINKYNQGHLFQDLISIINWLQYNPLIEKNSAQLLDSLFNEFSADEMIFLTSILPADEKNYKILHELVNTFPNIKKESQPSKFSLTPLTKKSFAAVLDLIVKLNDEGKIFPVIDRTTEIFKTMINRGQATYRSPVFSLPAHSALTVSQTWQISTWKSTKPNNPNPCLGLPLVFDFAISSRPFSVQTYKENLNLVSLCYEANQSFKSAEDLILYQLENDQSGNKLLKFNSLYKKFVGLAFALNSTDTTMALRDLINAEPQKIADIKSNIANSSIVLQKTKLEVTAATEIRSLIAKHTSKPETFVALLSQHNQLPPPAIKKRSKDSLALSIVNDIKKEMNEFCPGLNVDASNCDIEPDQVKEYLKSPLLLAHSIVDEYFSSKQSWAHPKNFMGWQTKQAQPTNVSQIEYHLNPLLKQVDHRPESIKSVFNFFTRSQRSTYNLLTELKNKAEALKLIPYVYQDPLYPENDGFQHYRQVRLRLVSDIDRLELLAINADFSAFGLMKNFGMDFIREIAVSWGDLPENKRPSLGTSETLAEARRSIYRKYHQYRANFFQKVDSCDSRGKTRFGRWIQSVLCSKELADSRARTFNLNYMLSIVDRDEDLVLLRDLFYSFYENNTDGDFGVYSNGVDESWSCLSPENNLDVNCRRDLLAMIPKIARLGVLHQAGVSLWLEESATTEGVINFFNDSLKYKTDKELSQFLSTQAGNTFIREIATFLTLTKPTEQNALSQALIELPKIQNQQWLKLLIEIAKTQPHLISTFAETLHFTLEDLNLNSFSPQMAELLTSVSADLNKQKIPAEISRILTALAPVQKELRSFKKSSNSTFDITPWLDALANSKNQSKRDQISSFFTTDEFDFFCDVYSDTKFIDKTYKFLDESHQNPGALELLDLCSGFLH